MTASPCSCTMPAAGPTPPSKPPTTLRRFAGARRRFPRSGPTARRPVTTDPSSSGAQARQELGARLRQIRKTAGVTGRDLAAATGQHVTRISRIENGHQPPTEANIRAWWARCGAADELADLLATAQAVETAYLEWARAARAGMRRLGDLHSIATYQRTATFRIHEPGVLPDIVQNEAYQRRMLAWWYAFLNAPDDTEAVLAMRAQRTAIALQPSKRLAIVLGEQALRTRRGTPSEHADQLTHLLSVARLPNVSLGVIPANARRRAIASIGFWIFDQSAVALETPTAAIKVTRPQEIARYVTLFQQLQAEAVRGHRARRLITNVLEELQ